MNTDQLKSKTVTSRGVESHLVPSVPRPPPLRKLLLAAGIALLLTLAIGLSILIPFYLHFSRIIDARLDGNVFGNPAVILAAPTALYCGQLANSQNTEAILRRAGYKEGQNVQSLGSFLLTPNGLEVHPGPDSYFQTGHFVEGPALLQFKADHLDSITDLDKMTSVKAYFLEPEPITTLFGASRAKRQLIRYQDLPQSLVDAILATEDHRFYSHHGVDAFRMLAAALADLRSDKRLQGGSTLTMQLARNLFLSPRRTIRRKLEEICFAVVLEHRLTKQQILVLYANQVYLGQRDSFSINGFGEAAAVYFNKDVSALSLPEAAFLTGLIRGPNLYLPYQHPERAAGRRNFVLARMHETGFITEAAFKQASVSPLKLTEQPVEARQQAYFVDMVKAQLLEQFSEEDLMTKGYRVYSTLDLNLQQAASDGAQAGLMELDKQIKSSRDHSPKSPPETGLPQAAMVALDPATGDVKALVGGRGYSGSQLNHVLARRQPGSSFKPFVYAAALNSGVDGSLPLVTPATVLADAPTAFGFSNLSYAPKDFKGEYQGSVTVRRALTYSLNVPAVHLAEMVGYNKVRNLALRAGFNNQLQATPSIALGAYVATPMEVAGAYTIFANHGEYAAPRCIVAVVDSSGQTVWDNPVTTRHVLDSRVSYLMVSLMESVINNGTGAGVRVRGFRLPAAGKTGTSHDGWFAGFTSNLLAVAWVGYDDDRDLNITGAQSALPLWTEFMKRSSGFSLYSSPLPFNEPYGIETAAIDNLTNLVAAADPVLTHSEVFIAGTEPFPPLLGEPGTATLGTQTQLNRPPGNSVLPEVLGNIVLVSNASNPQAGKVYVNTTALFPADPNPDSRSPGSTPPPAQ